MLWGLGGGLPVPWHDERLQSDILSALLALRELRSQYIDIASQRDALLAEAHALRASPQPAPPVQQPAAFFVPFAGAGRQLDTEDLSRLD